ncbi:hypothetical protein E2C01_008888 [Portunus trituberculatus]|uniref:Uncharacterized protein n=1 Tax=Portunus trituberculatus TaxID=210409 RepID=A0A5B7D562_PORTR|nr:hypothetical protein [Portunus trituberculatus]
MVIDDVQEEEEEEEEERRIRTRALGDPSDPKARMVPLYHAHLNILDVTQKCFRIRQLLRVKPSNFSGTESVNSRKPILLHLAALHTAPRGAFLLMGVCTLLSSVIATSKQRRLTVLSHYQPLQYWDAFSP